MAPKSLRRDILEEGLKKRYCYIVLAGNCIIENNYKPGITLEVRQHQKERVMHCSDHTNSMAKRFKWLLRDNSFLLVDCQQIVVQQVQLESMFPTQVWRYQIMSNLQLLPLQSLVSVIRS